MLKECSLVIGAAAAALAVALVTHDASSESSSSQTLPTAATVGVAASEGAGPAGPPVELQTSDAATKQAARASLFHKALHFEPNNGQIPAGVDYAARGLGYGIYMRGPSATLTLQRSGDAPNTELRMRFDGGSDDAASEPLAASDGRANYMVGPEESWVRNVPRYARLRYADVYPGVDVVYYGNQRRLEYDCVVAPGADPAQIRIAVDGADALTLSSDGDLLLGLAGGNVVQHAPIAYQDIDGSREPVEAAYRVGDDGLVGFELGPYDRSVALVIDPVISYATYLGGSFGEGVPSDIAVDADGYAYVVGTTPSFNFPANVTIGSVVDKAPAGLVTPDGEQSQRDVIVVKFLPDGSDVVYSTRIGGFDIDSGYGIAIDASGNAYATGYTYSPNYPVTNDAFQRFNANDQDEFLGSDAFLTELNATGNGLVYSTFLGGRRSDVGFGVDVDGSGNMYVVGGTDSFDFPTNGSAARPFYSGGGGGQTTSGVGLNGDGDGDLGFDEGFVTKFAPAGTVTYSTYVTGATGSEVCDDVIANDAGYATVVGSTNSFDFLTLAFPTKTADGLEVQNYDAFVLRLLPDGSDFEWSTTLGGSGDDYGTGVGLDASDNIYICGGVGGSFPLVNPLRSTFVTDFGLFPGESFVAKYVPSVITAGFTAVDSAPAREPAYITYVGGSGSEILLDMDVAADGAATVIGTTTSTDLQLVDAIPDLLATNQTTMGFLATLTPTGSALTMQSYIGGTGDDWGTGVALGPDGSIFCTGYTDSEDFPVTAGAFQTTLRGGMSEGEGIGEPDYFVVRLDPTPVEEEPTFGGLFIRRVHVRGKQPYGPVVKVSGFIDTGLPLRTLERRLPRPPRLDPPPPFPLYSLNASVQMGPVSFGVPFFFKDKIRVRYPGDAFSRLRRYENFRIFFTDLTLESDPNVFVELKAHRLNMSSRARFRMIFEGDVTPAVFPGSNFTVSIATPAFSGAGTVTLADGRNYNSARARSGTLLGPDFVVRRFKSKLRRRRGNGNFNFAAAFTHDGAPTSAPDLRLAVTSLSPTVASGFDGTVPGSQFQKRGRNRFVFRGNTNGVRFAEIDYDRNIIRVYGNNLALSAFQEPSTPGRTISVPVQMLVGLDEDVRSVIVLAARTEDKLRY